MGWISESQTSRELSVMLFPVALCRIRHAIVCHNLSVARCGILFPAGLPTAPPRIARLGVGKGRLALSRNCQQERISFVNDMMVAVPV